jgi:hypothetical protein
MQQPSQGLPTEAADMLGKGFNNLDPQELSMLRELQDDLAELSPDKLKVLEQIIQFLKKNSDRYDDAVRMLVDKGVIEAGDLPPDYIPSFFAILENMVMSAMSGGQQKFARGGIASLRKKAKAVQKAGTGGDKILAHINPREAAMLQATRGGGMNPDTGLPEYGFFDDIGNFLKSAASVVLPVALGFMGVPPIIAGAVGSGVGAMINGASPGQALQAAAMGGIGGAVFSGVSNIGSEGGFWGGVQQGFSPATSGPLADMFGGYQAAPVSAGAYGGKMAPADYTGGSQLPSGASATSPAVAGGAASVAQPGILQTAGNWIAKNPWPAVGIAGLGGVALASAMQPDQVQAANMGDYKGPSEEDIQKARFPAGSFTQYVAPKVNVVPTYSPAYTDYPSYYAAKGGELDARIGGHLSGPGTGTSDSIPARLSDGEFVMTAKAVRGAGNGSRKAGAKKMYDLMHQFEKRA